MAPPSRLYRPRLTARASCPACCTSDQAVLPPPGTAGPPPWSGCGSTACRRQPLPPRGARPACRGGARQAGRGSGLVGAGLGTRMYLKGGVKLKNGLQARIMTEALQRQADAGHRRGPSAVSTSRPGSAAQQPARAQGRAGKKGGRPAGRNVQQGAAYLDRKLAKTSAARTLPASPATAAPVTAANRSEARGPSAAAAMSSPHTASLTSRRPSVSYSPARSLRARGGRRREAGEHRVLAAWWEQRTCAAAHQPMLYSSSSSPFLRGTSNVSSRTTSTAALCGKQLGASPAWLSSLQASTGH